MLRYVIISVLARFYLLTWFILWVMAKVAFAIGLIVYISAVGAGIVDDSFPVYAPWFGGWLAMRIARAALEAVWRRCLAVARR